MDGLTLTGDPEVDDDIMAFVKARQAIVTQSEWFLDCINYSLLVCCAVTWIMCFSCKFQCQITTGDTFRGLTMADWCLYCDVMTSCINRTIFFSRLLCHVCFSLGISMRKVVFSRELSLSNNQFSFPVGLYSVHVCTCDIFIFTKTVLLFYFILKLPSMLCDNPHLQIKSW